MNKYYEAYKNSINDRDPVFIETLSRYNKKLINILEIGCARNLDCGLGKSGDGWSSMFFAEYVGTYGGHLTIVELDFNNLENCKLITEDFKDKITYINDDGLKFLDSGTENYQLVLLDAGDDPKITFEMFEKCNRKTSDLLIDDFNPGGKGDILKTIHLDYQLFQVNHIHQMAFYPKLIKQS